VQIYKIIDKLGVPVQSARDTGTIVVGIHWNLMNAYTYMVLFVESVSCSEWVYIMSVLLG